MNERQPRTEPQALKPTLSTELATSVWEVFSTLPSNMNLDQLMSYRHSAIDSRALPWRRFVVTLQPKEKVAIKHLLDVTIKTEGITTLAGLANPDLDPREKANTRGFRFTRQHDRFLKIAFQGADPTEEG